MKQEQVDTVIHQLAAMGIIRPTQVHYNLNAAQLYEEAIKRGEGSLANGGALVVLTGKYTGRSPNDRFVVDEPSSSKHVDWGAVNVRFDAEKYDRLRQRVFAHMQHRDLFVQDLRVGADPAHQRKVRMINVWAWHNLFVRNMFINPSDDAAVLEPDFTVIGCPTFHAIPEIDGTRSEAFIIVHPGRREVLVGGSQYGGEMKKSIFSVMNYLLPLEGVFPMHCSANIGKKGDVAIFFGLSGTGKTTLSTDVRRQMIGDDEHGWSNRGVFNFEGGCYAKVINLSPKAEPEIWACTRKFGTILENVVVDRMTRGMDLNDASLTENTRACYPLSSLDNIKVDGQGGHPAHVIMLTADAFGIMPPVARLTPDQAKYHFLTGYTAKLAGTERGLKDPQATFSTCFGAPFMVHDPVVYANMLAQRLQETGAKCWLVNTGWTGGSYGVGHRMPIAETRAIIDHILANELSEVETRVDPVFGLHVPVSIKGVSSKLLTPRDNWQDQAAFDAKAAELAKLFMDNFNKKFAARVSKEVVACNPAPAKAAPAAVAKRGKSAVAAAEKNDTAAAATKAVTRKAPAVTRATAKATAATAEAEAAAPKAPRTRKSST